MEPMNIDIVDVAKILSCKTKLAIVYALSESSSSLSTMDLSVISGVLPQTFTHHIKMLTKIDLVGVEKFGREKRYFLKNHIFLDIVESLEELVPCLPKNNRIVFMKLSFARSCYDHLAGWLATEVTKDFVKKEVMKVRGDSFQITTYGKKYFSDQGIDINALKKRKRMLARCCVDWTQQKPHIGGSLGHALMTIYHDNGCFESCIDDRKLKLTPRGYDFFLRKHDIDTSRFEFINHTKQNMLVV